MKNWKTAIKACLVGLFGLCAMGAQATTDWPTAPVTIITPWAVGGLADQINRAMSEYGKEQYGQPLLADNILGSGGAIALTEYVKEAPNTHKLILGGEGSFAIAPLTMKVAYKFDDFIPVINIYSSTFVFLSNPKAKVESMATLKDYIAKGKTVKVGVNGTNSSEALQTAAFLTELGAKFKLIPYEGANEALTAVVSGEVTFATTHASLAREFVRAGNVKPVIAFDEKKLVDEVYNLESVGDYGLDTWMTNTCAVFIRAGTDPAIVEKNYQALKNILENPKLQQTAKNIGLRLDIRDGKWVKDYIDSTMTKAEKYSKLVK
ncbi:tripartite tricarboxylate transporter substrate binding protein [[Haemophilus] felis]|nr:tripartite tricarboxylate transporter substrate binding protein [[Haemophilus] felis]